MGYQRLNCTVLALMLLHQVLPAWSQTRFVPTEDSRLWIEGHSNINQFQCRAGQYQLEARLNPEADSKSPAAISPDQVFVEVRVPVGGFSCGNKRMDRDLKKALQADRFPAIHFSFLGAEKLAPTAPNDQSLRLRTQGNLTIAGVTRPIEFVVNGHRLADDRVRAFGTTSVRMTDYGMEPPKRFFGLVKVKDQLAVRFDLMLRRQELAKAP